MPLEFVCFSIERRSSFCHRRMGRGGAAAARPPPPKKKNLGNLDFLGSNPIFKEVCICVCISYSAERSFSGLRRLKTYLRSTIG